MSTHNIDYRDAVEHLPDGATLVLQDISWEDYEQLLSGLTDRPGVRITYDCGRLEIMSPLLEHEKCKEFIARVVDALCDELDLNFEAFGSTTWKRKQDARGTEPDTSLHQERGTDHWKKQDRLECRPATRSRHRGRHNKRIAQ